MPRHGIANAAELAQTAALPRKPPRISRKLRTAVLLLLNGTCRTQTAAAERVGMTREHLSRTLREPHIQAFIARETRGALATAQAPAAATLISLLEAQSENVRATVAERLLAIAGHAPDNTARVAVSVDVRAGYVIDLSGNARDMGTNMGTATITAESVNESKASGG
jgi:hypothetical protein